LAKLGRPEGFLDRQVHRWLHELDSYRAYAGYPKAAIRGVRGIADWLQRNQPSSGVPGLIHGDFHLGNVLFDRSGPNVVAIVDWEMCTIGDPLLDLGWLLATWPQPGQRRDILGSALARAGGLPNQTDLISNYARNFARDVFGHGVVCRAGLLQTRDPAGRHLRAVVVR
jgi:aminoglycoside phosphotransferase (APT) family kinase protein